MKKLLTMFAVLTALSFGAQASHHEATAPHSKKDEAAICKLVGGFAGHWNRHNVDGMLGAWTTDGDVINPSGRVARGWDEVRQLLADEHGGDFKKTKMAIKVETIRFLSDDVAVVDAQNTLSGLKVGTKKHPDFVHHMAAVVSKTSGGWKFESVRPYIFLSTVMAGKKICLKDGSCQNHKVGGAKPCCEKHH